MIIVCTNALWNFRIFRKILWQTPQPVKKKESSKNEGKFRTFIKRSSEPFINGQTQQLLTTNQHQTMIMEEFEPDVFRQVIEYIHTGCVTLQPRTLLGISLPVH